MRITDESTRASFTRVRLVMPVKELNRKSKQSEGVAKRAR